MSRIVLCNSGGAESLALAKKLHDEGHEVFSVYVDIWKWSGPRAMVAAHKIAEKYCTGHAVVSVSGFPFGSPNDPNPQTDRQSPEVVESYAKFRVRLPFGPSMHILLTAFIGAHMRAEYTAVGFDKVIHGIKDSSKDILVANKKMTELLPLISPVGISSVPILIAPLQQFSEDKTEAVAYYINTLGVTLDELKETVSCFCGLNKACGMCSKCLKRTELGYPETITNADFIAGVHDVGFNLPVYNLEELLCPDDPGMVMQSVD